MSSPRRAFINIAALKAHTTTWEPTPIFSYTPRHPQPQEDDDGEIEDHVPWITTYSAFDPDMMRPLLMSSLALPHLHHTPSNTKATKAAPADTKPWPYRLLWALQPKAETTYPEKYRGAKGKGEVGILQAVLYDLPEPEKRTRKGVILREGGLLWKVVYGDEDEDKKGEYGGKVGC
jgi:hypothetical protein